MIKVLTKIDEIDIKEWKQFVNNHPKGSVFQTYEMYRCYLKTDDYTPFALFAYENNEMVGVLLSVIMKEKGWLKSLFSTRSIVFSGPIVRNDDVKVLDALLECYCKMIDRRVIYTQIRNQFNQLDNCDTFRNKGFIFESHLNYLIKLDSQDAVWSRIGKGRAKQIQKAIRNGLVVESYVSDEITDEMIINGYDVISSVYRRSKLPLVDIQEFREAKREGLLILFMVKDSENTFLGCRFALAFNKTLYGWYAGSYDSYYHLYPNDALIWGTLKWGVEHDYEVFDYGGAGTPNEYYGVRKFKSQMGGDLVNFGRYQKVHKPLLYKIGKIGYAIYHKLKL